MPCGFLQQDFCIGNSGEPEPVQPHDCHCQENLARFKASLDGKILPEKFGAATSRVAY